MRRRCQACISLPHHNPFSVDCERGGLFERGGGGGLTAVLGKILEGSGG